MTKLLLATLGLAASLALLAGCESVADIDPPAHTPRLSVAYTLSNQPLSAAYTRFFTERPLYVSTSHSITEISRLVGRADATVALYDEAGQVVEQFRPRGRQGYNGADSTQGYYVPVRGYVGQPGRTYTLRASAPGVADTQATITLPAPTTVADGSYSLQTGPNNYQYQGRLKFSILDNAATTDYYLAYARALDANGQPCGDVWQDYSGRTTDGPDIRLTRFDLSLPPTDRGHYPVSDAGRQGQRLEYGGDTYISLYGGNGPGSSKPAYIEVIVSTIPASTYDFYQSVQRYYDVEGNPFAEPAPLHSNIQGGYGLFGGATDVSLRIKL